MPIKVSVPPVEEPLTLSEAKAQCHVDTMDDDTLIIGLISAAREWCEKMDWRAYVTQTLELWLDYWPAGAIIVPRPPLQTVESVEYYDIGDNAFTLSDSKYIVDAVSQPGRIVLRTYETWPITYPVLRSANGICVTYTAGYGMAVDVPQRIKQAMLLLVGHWYENRENTVVGTVNRSIEMGVQSLLGIDRAFRF
jgi:uncharacterized phiE125 gp8 family phage protein